MNWLQLIGRRKSVRQYLPEVDEATIARVRDICSQISAESDNPLELRLVPGLEIQPKLRGFVGGYGRILSPWYIAVIANGDKESMLNVGYRAEKAILEMTNLNLGTCWIGGMYDKQSIGNSLNIQGAEEIRALIAWGKPGKEGMNQTIKFFGGLGKRALPEKISVVDSKSEHLKYPWRAVLEAIRWAPSAINRQPWRLWFSPRSIHLFSDSRRSNRFTPTDIGIALCHLELACAQLGIRGNIAKSPHPEPKGWEYWVTYDID